jgi:cell division protein FtsI/penicillin-binding protein 2
VVVSDSTPRSPPALQSGNKHGIRQIMMDGFQCRRLLAMGFLMALAFACLGYRLVDLQVMQHEKLREESEEVTRQTFLRAPKRGDIRDVRGHLLAGSVFVKTICGNPAVIGRHRGEVARLIAPLLGMSPEEVFERLQPRWVTNRHGQVIISPYAPIKRKVPVETCDKIQAAMKQLPVGVDFRSLPVAQKREYASLRDNAIGTDRYDDQLRVYPNQSLAAHILGFVGTHTTDSPKGKVIDLEGKDGIEMALNPALTGVIGWRSTEVAKKRELVDFRDQDVEAHAGRNVILTVDLGVQHIVETELAEAMAKHTPISASAVVVRPRTGEILAMATLPSFDPNDLGCSVPDARRNRVITDSAEPGSTFKIVVISGALNDGLISLDDKFDCENGVFVFGGRALHDHEKYGVLTVEAIITHSSNIGAAKVGIKLGPNRLYEYMRSFGFGVKTGIPLVGEINGLVRPVNRWTKLSISHIPMGHEVTVTPLQMTMAMCAVANGGRLMRPMLVDRLEDDEGHVLFKNYPQPVRQVVSERAAKLMITALKTVVATNATGRKAMLDHYTAAGKTGTAQKVVRGVYRRDKHFSSFIGFFPADNAEVCVAVFLDEPKNGYYGGEAAAPVFHDIAERVAQYLAIRPDILPPAPVAPVTVTAPAQLAVLATTRHPRE